MKSIMLLAQRISRQLAILYRTCPYTDNIHNNSFYSQRREVWKYEHMKIMISWYYPLVVQTLDGAIHQIYRYPMDKY